MGAKPVMNRAIETDLKASSDFQRRLAAALPEMAAEAYERSQHLTIVDCEGGPHPPNNYLSIPETFEKFRREFLPLSPVVDPLGRKIIVRLNNFPKLLNLKVSAGASKKAHTIIEELEGGSFNQDGYCWERDRLEDLFWIPELIRCPDAIYRKKTGFGVVEADEVYLKVYKKEGSPVKVLFTQRVGPRKDRVVITSYVTSRSTAKLYAHGEPLYHRELSKK